MNKPSPKRASALTSRSKQKPARPKLIAQKPAKAKSVKTKSQKKTKSAKTKSTGQKSAKAAARLHSANPKSTREQLAQAVPERAPGPDLPKKTVGPHGLAYHNPAFMKAPEARPLRILAEYMEPACRFRELDIADTIVFFGSARILSRDEAQVALDAARKLNGDDPEALERVEVQFTMSRYYEETRELARRLAEWSETLEAQGKGRRFVVCSGGGPGIMEAANRGASEAGATNIGLNIEIPFEQQPNSYISPELNIDFHYFFMRKFWFAYLAKAMICMPGGFGTLDELSEILTLIQTLKIKKKMPIVLYGSEFWRDIIDFNALVKYGTISRQDLDLMYRTDSVDDAFEHVTRELTRLYLDDPSATM